MKHVRLYLQPFRAEEGGDDGAGAGAGGGGDGGAGDGQSPAGGGDSDSGDPPGDSAAGGGGDGDSAGAGAGPGDGVQESWRDRITGLFGEDYEEADALNHRLGRYTDEKSFVESAIQAHEKLRKGEVQTGLPENPTEEQLQAYREANGIPLDGDYLSGMHFEEGVELTAQDKEILGPVLEIWHQGNVPADVASATVNAWKMGVNAAAEKRATQDTVDAQTFEAQAKENWAGDFDENMNRVSNLLNQLPESVRDAFKSGRLADGKAVGSSLEVMNWLASIDRQLNPMGPLPAGEGSPYKSAQAIIKESEDRMANDRANWYKDNEAQKQYMRALDFMKSFDERQAG